jgi:Xaa-Pro dipeptidase
MSEYRDRLARTRDLIGSRGLTALIMSTPGNVFYLTGYETQGLWYPNLLVVPVDGEPFMVTRQAEETVVEADTWIELSRPFWDSDDPMETLAAALAEFGLAEGALGIEADSYYLRVYEHDRLGALLGRRPIATSGIVESLRVIKSDAEIALMRRSAAATDAGVMAAVKAVEVGETENDVAAAAYGGMLAAGAHWGATAPWVVSGPRSFVSHATWRGRRIEAGDPVFLEIGATVHRYQTATMRTVVAGDLSPRMREAEAVINEATDAALAMIRPGVLTADVDRVARDVIAHNTFGARQYTRVGYGIGISFPPGWGEGHVIDIKQGNTSRFAPSMTFHVIPFLQIQGEAAIGTSETVLVTQDGCERLTGVERRIFTR